MALNFIQGEMGAGKSYVLCNRIMADFLRNSKRHVYTNLPINEEDYLCWLSRRASKRSEIQQRLHFLKDQEHTKSVVVLDKEGEPMKGPDGKVVMEVMRYHEIREFWFHVEPGSVICLDETFDYWNKTRYKEAPLTLQTFINHHRHYQLDLFFSAQDKEDVHSYVSGKIKYVYDIRNSKYEPMLPEVPIFAGLRWPWQFFIVRVVAGRTAMGRRGDMRKFRKVDSFVVWPNQRGFKNYRSFSAAPTLKGMKTVQGSDGPDSEGQASESMDMETTVQRVLRWSKQGSLLIGGSLVALVLFYVVLMLWVWTAGGFEGSWYGGGFKKAGQIMGILKDDPKTNVVELANTNLTLTSTVALSNEVKQSNLAPLMVTNRILMATGRGVLMSNGQCYKIGDMVDGDKLVLIRLDGCVLGTNQVDWGTFSGRASRGAGGIGRAGN